MRQSRALGKADAGRLSGRSVVLTILRKRDAFREAFRNFDPEKVARFGEADIVKLLANAGIVRSRAKIEATIGGARAYLAMRDAGEDFSTFIWDLVGGSPNRNSGEALQRPRSPRRSRRR